MNKRLFLNISIITILLLITLMMGIQAATGRENLALSSGTTLRVSLSSDGKQGNDESDWSSISNDGRYVAFRSDADNLVSGDTNDFGDIFVRDRQFEITTRVSVSSDGAQANDESRYPSISADGHYVVFESDADNLVSGDTNGYRDIFVHDQQTGDTQRVSVASNGTQGNNNSRSPSISSNGRYVAFQSLASKLVNGDTNGYRDIFVHDQQTGVTQRVSVASNGTQGNGHSYGPSISADGRYVAFDSDASNLVSGDTNDASDIFVHDRQTGVTSLVSVTSDGDQANSSSYSSSISADGRYVAFSSDAKNLVSGDDNSLPDVFVHDRQTGTTSHVSVASDGTKGNSGAYGPSISTGGSYVVFHSDSNNLVNGDTNGAFDVFVRDLQTSTTTRISVASDGTQGNNSSWDSSISDDGRYVAFASYASNLVIKDTNGTEDSFVHDRGEPPSLTINYPNGAPGSYFNITGSDYPPNAKASLSINGSSLGDISTSETGTFTFTLSTGNADEGSYFITVSVNPQATTQFKLDASDPTRPQEGSYPIFDVPAGIAFTNMIYLPNVIK